MRAAPGPIRGLVLFYPAVDVHDEAQATAVFPVPCSVCGVQYKQSLLSWFFEKAVLRLPSRGGGDSKQAVWSAANPLAQLRKYYTGECDQLPAEEGILHNNDGSICNESPLEFPPTLILHGQLDAIVPIEQSEHWLRAVYQCAPSQEAATAAGTTAEAGNGSKAAVRRQSNVSSPIRAADTLISIPGAKHSYEIAASALVDVTIQGVLGWLMMHTDKDDMI